MSWLEEIWWRPPPGRGPMLATAPLAAAEALFRAGAAARGALFDRGLARAELVAAPVISVGNLVVGGAGKTPVTLALAERLLGRGRRVAVLSRGYGASRGGERLVSDGRRLLLLADEAGDEPALLARRLPGVAVLCGRGRAALARRAVDELGADALLLDDGFQHRALGRDLDLVVLDAASPCGNGRLLPRGPNREPWRALGRAQLAWLSRIDQADAAAREALRARVREATGRAPVESRHAVVDVLDGGLERSLGPGALSGQRVLALCALARPEGFRRTLLDLGAEVALERSFRDHHRFTPAELEEATGAAQAAGCDAIATTEKDAVRLPPAVAADPRWRVVRIRAEIRAGEAELEELLAAALARGDARRAGRSAPSPAPGEPGGSGPAGPPGGEASAR